MNKPLLVFLYIIFCSSALSEELASGFEKSADNLEQYLAFQASVDGQQLLSNDFPVGSITFDPALTYVGSESFILYKVARVEIHLYAQKDSYDGVKRLYWVQYESYLPSNIRPDNPELSEDDYLYDYSNDPYRIEIGGRKFYGSVNYWNAVIPKERLFQESGPEDSDAIRAFRLLAREGYIVDDDVMTTRLVHLDKSKKKELMIMYIEAMGGQGLSIKAFGKEGKTSQMWEDVSQDLRKRAVDGIQVIFD